MNHPVTPLLGLCYALAFVLVTCAVRMVESRRAGDQLRQSRNRETQRQLSVTR